MDPIKMNINTSSLSGPVKWPYEVNPKPVKEPEVPTTPLGDKVEISFPNASPKKDILPGVDIPAKLPQPKIFEEAPPMKLPEVIDGWNIAGLSGVGAAATLVPVSDPLSRPLTFGDTGINTLESMAAQKAIFYMDGAQAAGL